MRISVRLSKEIEAKLRRVAKQKGCSLSAFMRAAITEKLEQDPSKPTPYELGKHLFGRYSSGLGDLASNHEKYLQEKLRAKHRR